MKYSIKELRKSCDGRRFPNSLENKNKLADCISLYITRILLNTKITPNQITILNLIVTILGFIFLLFGNIMLMLTGMLMFFSTAFFLDTIDGQIARVKKTSSLVGMHLEAIYHDLSHLMLFGLGFGVYQLTSYESAIIFGFLGSLFSYNFFKPSLAKTILEYRLKMFGNKDTKIKRDRINNEDVNRNNIVNFITKIFGLPTAIYEFTLIVILEIINSYINIAPQFSIIYWSLAIYAIGVTVLQIGSFITYVNRRKIDYYYNLLFGR